MSFLRNVSILLMAAFSLSAWAGSKGFTVVLLEIGDQSFFKSHTYTAVINGYPDSKVLQDCWSDRATGGKDFEMMIRKAVPDGLNTEIAKSIWDGDLKAAKRAQQLMTRAIAPNHQQIDGLYVVSAQSGRVSVMALGTKAPLGPKNPSRKLTIPWREEDPERGAADFVLALCRVSRPLDYHFSP